MGPNDILRSLVGGGWLHDLAIAELEFLPPLHTIPPAIRRPTSAPELGECCDTSKVAGCQFRWGSHLDYRVFQGLHFIQKNIILLN